MLIINKYEPAVILVVDGVGLLYKMYTIYLHMNICAFMHTSMTRAHVSCGAANSWIKFEVTKQLKTIKIEKSTGENPKYLDKLSYEYMESACM